MPKGKLVSFKTKGGKVVCFHSSGKKRRRKTSKAKKKRRKAASRKDPKKQAIGRLLQAFAIRNPETGAIVRGAWTPDRLNAFRAERARILAGTEAGTQIEGEAEIIAAFQATPIEGISRFKRRAPV